MKHNFLQKKSAVLAFGALLWIAAFSAPLFAQEEHEEVPLEELEQNSAEPEKTAINPELQKNFTIVMNRMPYNLNPHTSQYSSEAQILTGLYEGLFSYDPISLEPVYAIAKSYKVSRNKKRWTFVLKEGVTFSDGTPITANSVRDSWIALISNPGAAYSSLFDIIKGAESLRTGRGTAEQVAISVLDDYTISVQLNSPASHLPKLLCMPAFSVVSSAPGVFSGPFTLAARSNEYIILARNEKYHDVEHVPLEKITVVLSSDEDDNTALFNMGLADWVSGSFNPKKLLSKNVTQIYAEFATQYIFFKIGASQNFTPQTRYNYKKFRQALLEAVPWEKLRASTYVPATTFIYPLSGYPAVEGYAFTDALEAKELMSQFRAEMNYSDDTIIDVPFAIPANDSFREKATVLKEAWAPLGVNVDVIELEENTYLSEIELIPSGLMTYTWIGDFADPLAFLELFRGDSTLNVSNWKNTEFDKLLSESLEYSNETHYALLAKAEQILLDEAVVLPIQHPVSVNVIDLKATGGWASNAFDIHPLKYLFKRETKDVIPNIALR